MKFEIPCNFPPKSKPQTVLFPVDSSIFQNTVFLVQWTAQTCPLKLGRFPSSENWPTSPPWCSPDYHVQGRLFFFFLIAFMHIFKFSFCNTPVGESVTILTGHIQRHSEARSRSELERSLLWWPQFCDQPLLDTRPLLQLPPANDCKMLSHLHSASGFQNTTC